jgi:hypothetical protein
LHGFGYGHLRDFEGFRIDTDESAAANEFIGKLRE